MGDDEDMQGKKKKPSPDIFLLALERINEFIARWHGKANEAQAVKPEECLIFEDSISGVEAARAAGMRVVWVPHEDLREVCRGREQEVLDGTVNWGKPGEEEMVPAVDGAGRQDETAVFDMDLPQKLSKDGRAEMLNSLESFPYRSYGFHIQ